MPVPLSRDAILERLRDILPHRIDVDPALLVPDAALADIGIDSFALIELVFLAEDTYGIRIPMEGLKVRTLGDVLDVVVARLEEVG
jgi:acyl carrier protein